jgi:hypothetical protein
MHRDTAIQRKDCVSSALKWFGDIARQTNGEGGILHSHGDNYLPLWWLEEGGRGMIAPCGIQYTLYMMNDSV